MPHSYYYYYYYSHYTWSIITRGQSNRSSEPSSEGGWTVQHRPERHRKSQRLRKEETTTSDRRPRRFPRRELQSKRYLSPVQWCPGLHFLFVFKARPLSQLPTSFQYYCIRVELFERHSTYVPRERLSKQWLWDALSDTMPIHSLVRLSCGNVTSTKETCWGKNT